jgi:drug/metabolite transporter (DMT)-like permease
VSGAAFGVLAALILGVNTILIAVSARWLGVWRTTASALIIAFVFLLFYAGLTSETIPLDAGGLLWLMAVLGFAAGSSYFASHQALRLGPVSVVSPIGSTTGAMTVVLAFLILGERPDLIQWVGIPLATAGVVLLSIERSREGHVRLIGWGPLFALLGVVTGAVSNAVLRIPIRQIGDIQAILTQRAFTVAFVLMAIPFVARARTPVSVTSVATPLAGSMTPGGVEVRLTPKAAGLLILIGLLDAAAFLAFAKGLTVAPAWQIGLISQSGRIIAIIGGYLFFNERLRSSQWIGLALTILGLVLVVAG